MLKTVTVENLTASTINCYKRIKTSDGVLLPLDPFPNNNDIETLNFENAAVIEPNKVYIIYCSTIPSQEEIGNADIRISSNKNLIHMGIQMTIDVEKINDPKKLAVVIVLHCVEPVLIRKDTILASVSLSYDDTTTSPVVWRDESINGIVHADTVEGQPLPEVSEFDVESDEKVFDAMEEEYNQQLEEMEARSAVSSGSIMED